MSSLRIRLPIVLMSLSLCALSTAQDLNKAITFTSRARPLKEVLAHISSACNLSLSAADQMAMEPLILQVDNIPAQQVLDKIANAFQAEWTKTDDGLKLQRSKEKIAELRKLYLEDRTQRFKEIIESLVRRVEQNGPLDDSMAETLAKSYTQGIDEMSGRVNLDYQTQFDRKSKMPMFRFMVAMFAQLDPKELAAIPTRQRVVFANSPLPMQRAFPKFDLRQFVQFRSDRNKIAAAAEKLSIDRSYTPHEFGGDSTPLSEPPAKALFSFLSHEKYLSADVSLLDGESKLLGSINVLFTDSLEKEKERGSETVEARAEAIKSGFTLGQVGAELAPRLRRYDPNNPANLRGVNDAVIQALMSPTKNDPLSFSTTDILLTGAAKEKKNVIALLPDESDWSALMSARNGKTSLRLFLAMLMNSVDVIDDSGDRWLELRPADPLRTASERVPRDLAEKIMRKVFVDGFISLEEVGGARAALPYDNTLDLCYGRIPLRSDGGKAMNGRLPITRLYGLLAEEHRAQANDGGFQAALGTFTVEQQDNIYRYITESGISMGELSRPLFQNEGVVSDITEHLPLGVPMSSIVTVKVQQNRLPTIAWKRENGTLENNIMEVEGLPMYVARERNPKEFPMFDRPGEMSFAGFRYSNQRQLIFRLDIDSDHWFLADASEPLSPIGDPMTAEQFLATLPLKDRERVEAQVAAILRRRSSPPMAVKP